MEPPSTRLCLEAPKESEIREEEGDHFSTESESNCNSYTEEEI